MSTQTKNTKATATQTTASHLHVMKQAIIKLHEENNTHAINLDDCSEFDITNQSFTQWTTYVEELRQTLIPYVEKTLDKDSNDKAISTAEGKVFAMWKDVLTDAMGKQFSRNWFVRKSDTAWLLRAVVRNVNTANGSMYGFRAKTEFRREVERLIGCRLASNAILSEEDSDLIKGYESAQRNVEKKTELLEKGTKKELSLYTQLENARTQYDKKYEEYKQNEQIMAIEGLIDELTKSEASAITDLKTRIESAEKSKNASLEFIGENTKRYKEIMATVAKIEG